MSSEILGNEEIEFETTTSRRNVFFWAMYDLAIIFEHKSKLEKLGVKLRIRGKLIIKE